MISVDNIYKRFGSLEVLKGVSCKIEKGEKVVIIGPSGSGKSTLLRCMNLLEEPTFGEVWLDDKLMTRPDPYLHFDLIEKTRTYKKMLAAAEERGEDKETARDRIIREIKEKDLLNERHEGREYKKAYKEFYENNRIDINKGRARMGMVFQHFNLFNNLNVLQNLTLAPVKLKLKTQEEAEADAEKLLTRIG